DDEAEEVHSGEILSASLADDEEMSTTNQTSLEKLSQKIKQPPKPQPRLPGMRSMPGVRPAAKPGPRAPLSNEPAGEPGLYADSGPLTDESDTPDQEEETSERLKPTLAARSQKSSPDDEETAVSAPGGKPLPINHVASLLQNAPSMLKNAPAAPVSLGPTAPWP